MIIGNLHLNPSDYREFSGDFPEQQLTIGNSRNKRLKLRKFSTKKLTIKRFQKKNRKITGILKEKLFTIVSYQKNPFRYGNFEGKTIECRGREV